MGVPGELTAAGFASTMYPDGRMNQMLSAARKPFLQLAQERVVVLDGAMGANLQTRALDLHRDWLGQENISEVLNFSRPDVIQEIHEAFLEAGCDGVETNTFGANKIVMAEAGMADRVFEVNKTAVEIARRACEKFETPERDRKST